MLITIIILIIIIATAIFKFSQKSNIGNSKINKYEFKYKKFKRIGSIFYKSGLSEITLHEDIIHVVTGDYNFNFSGYYYILSNYGEESIVLQIPPEDISKIKNKTYSNNYFRNLAIYSNKYKIIANTKKGSIEVVDNVSSNLVNIGSGYYFK